MNENKQLRKGIRSGRKLLYCCVVCVIILTVWAGIGKLAIVSISNGEVVPSTQVKTVQHLEGGIVREIKVTEGQQVQSGQILVALESTASGADVTELGARINGLKIEVARLVAEVKGTKVLKLEKSLLLVNPKLASDAASLFLSRRNRLLNEQAIQGSVISQREQDIREISARVRNVKQTLKHLREQIGISEQLMKEDLTNRYKHLDLLREASTLNGKVEEGVEAIKRAKLALRQARVNLKRVKNKYVEEANTSLELARRQLEELTPRMMKFKDSLRRTVLKSPVTGVIKKIHIATIGGVIGPGTPVVDIVPADDHLVVETKLPTQDVGYVRSGQRAYIKLASSDSIRFDNLEGKVFSVSPDTFTTRNGQPFYKVRIQTNRDFFKRDTERYQLFPGMQVVASIHTGERTVLQYVADPFIRSLGSALTER